MLFGMIARFAVLGGHRGAADLIKRSLMELDSGRWLLESWVEGRSGAFVGGNPTQAAAAQLPPITQAHRAQECSPAKVKPGRYMSTDKQPRGTGG